MRFLVLLLLAALHAGVAAAAGTKSWELSQYADFLAGTFRDVALDRDGSLRVAPSLDEVFASDQAVVWSMALDPDGNPVLVDQHV